MESTSRWKWDFKCGQLNWIKVVEILFHLANSCCSYLQWSKQKCFDIYVLYVVFDNWKFNVKPSLDFVTVLKRVFSFPIACVEKYCCPPRSIVTVPRLIELLGALVYYAKDIACHFILETLLFPRCTFIFSIFPSLSFFLFFLSSPLPFTPLFYLHSSFPNFTVQNVLWFLFAYGCWLDLIHMFFSIQTFSL